MEILIYLSILFGVVILTTFIIIILQILKQDSLMQKNLCSGVVCDFYIDNERMTGIIHEVKENIVIIRSNGKTIQRNKKRIYPNKFLNYKL